MSGVLDLSASTYLIIYGGQSGPRGPAGTVVAGGSTGQYLIKNSNADYDVSWATPGILAGGTIGQALIKNSSTNGDASWANPVDITAIHLAGSETVTGNKVFSGTISMVDANLTLLDNVDSTKKAQFELSGLTTNTTRTYTLPDANVTLASRAGTETLSNKTLDNTASIGIQAPNFGIQDNTDHSKIFRFSAASISTATTRTITVPDASDTMVLAATAQTLSNKTVSGLTITDATNITLGTTTGSMIGTNTGQKIGFYGTSPTAQQAATVDLGTTLSNLGLRAAGTAYPITTSGATTFSGASASLISNLSIQDATDNTKQLKFDLSGFTTGTTRTFGLPNASDTIVTLAATQTLTNKSLTSSQISDFTEAAQDAVAAMIVAGTNITISYNDAANTFTINSSGGGGGGTWGSITGTLSAQTDLNAALTAPTFTGTVTISDAQNVVLGTTTGTIIGTTTSQKLGFFGVAPVTQRSATMDLGTALAGLGLRASGSAYPLSTTGNVVFNGAGTVSTTNLVLQDATDATKQVQFSMAGITTATTRTITIPDANDTMVNLASAQTLINKTLNGVTISDAGNIVLGSTTGTKIGTATTQKLGFFNTTPVVQPGATVDIGTVMSSLGLRASGTAFPMATSGTVALTGTTSIVDSGFTIIDNVDATKKAAFEVSGITTGTTRTFTFPDSSGTLLTSAAVVTLSNKTFDNTNTFTFKDTLTTFQDNADATKQFLFDAALITTGTTRTYQLPDASGVLLLSSSTTTLSNKTFDNTNTFSVKDTLFSLQDNGDATKIAQFDLSTIPTATTNTYILPDGSDTLVGLTDLATVARTGSASDLSTGTMNIARLPAGSTVTIYYNTGSSSWPARPTSRTDICVIYTYATNTTPDPSDAVTGVDKADKPV